MIFLDFFKSKKNYENMLQNAPNGTIKNFFSMKHAPPPQIIVAHLANPAYAHELLLRNLFENPPWQTVDCV